MKVKNILQITAKIFGVILFFGGNLPLGFFNILALQDLVFREGIHQFWRFFSGFPLDLKTSMVLIVIAPFISIPTGIRLMAEGKWDQFLAFVIGIELPLVFLAFSRLFLAIFGLYPSTISSQILALIALSVTGYSISVAGFRPRNKWMQGIMLFTQQAGLVLVSWLALIWLILLPLLVVLLPKGWLIEFGHWELGHFELEDILFFFLYFAMIVCAWAGPPLLVCMFAKSTKRELNLFTEGWGKISRRVVTFGPPFFLIFYFIFNTWNPSHARLRNWATQYMEAQTFSQEEKIAQMFRGSEGKMKRHFGDLYLSSRRYMVDEENSEIGLEMQKHLLVSESTGRIFQILLEKVAFPIIYQGNSEEDGNWAFKAYRAVFDQSVQEGEHDLVQKTMDAHWRTFEKAGLVDKFKKSVLVTNWKISAKAIPGYDLGEVTIQETYQNETENLQEVFYAFSLPENAVISELRLGPNLEYVGQVAPKGAARRTYEEQIRRTLDPALLEEVGPRQYRLRVYPIPLEHNWENKPLPETERQRVMLRYVAPLNQNGSVSLPQVTETRSVFWNRRTKNQTFGKDHLEHWSSTRSIKVKPENNFSRAEGYEIGPWVVWHAPKTESRKYFGQPSKKNLRVAILYDRSASAPEDLWAESFKENWYLQDMMRTGEVFLWPFNHHLGKPVRLKYPKDFETVSQSPVHGHTDLFSVLAEFCKKKPENFDMVLVLSDKGEMGEPPGMAKPPCHLPKIYLAHQGGAPQYHDALANWVLESGGAVVDKPEQALEAFEKTFIRKDSLHQPPLYLSTLGEKIWLAKKASGHLPSCPAKKPICKVLARRLVLERLRQAPLGMDGLPDNKVLDEVHAISQKYGIVTPFSSLIALVDFWQKQQLESESQMEDRFKAGYDTGEENLIPIAAVPEPEFYALLLVIIGIIWWDRQKKKRSSFSF